MDLDILAILTSVEAIITTLVALFIAISKLTPNKRDDKISTKAGKYWKKTQLVIDRVTPFIPSRVEPEPKE